MLEKNVSVNPSIVFREDFDDIAILYDPDSGKAFSLNRTGVLVWKSLDGKRSVSEVVASIISQCNDTPHNIERDAIEFIDHLIQSGLAGYVV